MIYTAQALDTAIFQLYVNCRHRKFHPRHFTRHRGCHTFFRINALFIHPGLVSTEMGLRDETKTFRLARPCLIIMDLTFPPSNSFGVVFAVKGDLKLMSFLS
jgi:hypothetical protein